MEPYWATPECSWIKTAYLLITTISRGTETNGYQESGIHLKLYIQQIDQILIQK